MTEGWSAIVKTPLPDNPRLGLVTGAQGLLQIRFLPAETPLLPARDRTAAHFAAQIESYFRGALTRFTGPLAPADTPFRGRVRSQLAAIRPGTVVTYGKLARELQSGPRAVAGACRANPLPLVVPCHRVVAAGGAGGYMGATGGRALAYKKWLLRHEGAE